MSSNALGFLLQKRKRVTKWADDYSSVPAPVLDDVTAQNEQGDTLNLNSTVDASGTILFPYPKYFDVTHTVKPEIEYAVYPTADFSTAPILTGMISEDPNETRADPGEGVWYVRYRGRYTDGVNSGPWSNWLADDTPVALPASIPQVVPPLPETQTFGTAVRLPPVSSFGVVGGYTVPDATDIYYLLYWDDNPRVGVEFVGASLSGSLDATTTTEIAIDPADLLKGDSTYRTATLYYYLSQSKGSSSISPHPLNPLVTGSSDLYTDGVVYPLTPSYVDTVGSVISESPGTLTIPPLTDFLFTPASSSVGYDTEVMEYEINTDNTFADPPLYTGTVDPVNAVVIPAVPDTTYYTRYRIRQTNTAENAVVTSGWLQQPGSERVHVQFDDQPPSIVNKTLLIPPLSEFTVGPGRTTGTYTITAVMSDDAEFAGTASVLVGELQKEVDVASYVALYVRYMLTYTYDTGPAADTYPPDIYPLPVDIDLTLTSITEATVTSSTEITLSALSGFVYSNSTDEGVVIQYEINGTTTGFVGATPTVLAVAPDTTYTIRYRSYRETTNTLFYSDWVAQADVVMPSLEPVPAENTVASYSDMSGPLPAGIEITGLQGEVTTSGTTISVTADGSDLIFDNTVGTLVQSGIVAVSLWANVASAGTLVAFGSGGTTLFYKHVVHASGDINRLYKKNGISSVTIPAGIVAGQWHHYVTVKNANSVSLFVDGVSYGTVTTENGSWNSVCTFGNGINGAYAIDRLKFFDIEPTTQQIADLYAQGAPP